jgi:hypothetical protein
MHLGSGNRILGGVPFVVLATKSGILHAFRLYYSIYTMDNVAGN